GLVAASGVGAPRAASGVGRGPAAAATSRQFVASSGLVAASGVGAPRAASGVGGGPAAAAAGEGLLQPLLKTTSELRVRSPSRCRCTSTAQTPTSAPRSQYSPTA